MKQSAVGALHFPAINAVLYFSEKHATLLPNGRIAYAIAIYECFGALNDPWKMIFVNSIVQAWSALRTGDGTAEGSNLKEFDVMHDIPDRMSRSDMWYLEYQRNRYPKNISDERLKVLYHRNIAISSINLMKGDWPKLSQEQLMENMRRFAHIIEETNRRGIDLRTFSPKELTPEQRAEVYQGLPAKLIATLTEPPRGTAWPAASVARMEHSESRANISARNSAFRLAPCGLRTAKPSPPPKSAPPAPPTPCPTRARSMCWRGGRRPARAAARTRRRPSCTR